MLAGLAGVRDEGLTFEVWFQEMTKVFQMVMPPDKFAERISMRFLRRIHEDLWALGLTRNEGGRVWITPAA